VGSWEGERMNGCVLEKVGGWMDGWIKTRTTG
jgi:hypothetical protein